jgi:phosphoribosyl 1,2-cyclic phosphodiesterase
MLKIKLWGTRGSIPTPYTPQEIENRVRTLFECFFEEGHTKISELDSFLKSLPRHVVGGWGGNTACIEFKSSKSHFIIDAGSGLKSLNQKMMNGPLGKGKGEAHLFFTHFHWDHISGLPFFIPMYVPGNKIHLYAVQKELPEMIETLFRKPYFPVNAKDIAAKIVYHQLSPRKPVKMNDVTLTPYLLDHPDPCWGYRIEHGKKAMAYCVDTEGTRISELLLDQDLPMYQNLDFMIYDSQYTIEEAIARMNWGHAAATIGLDLAIREKIKKVAFIHHDPNASDEKIAFGEMQAREYFHHQMKMMVKNGIKAPQVEWSFAREGDESEL